MSFVCATLLILCGMPSGSLDYDYQKKFVHEITNCALQYNSSVYPYDRIPILIVQAQSIQESNWGRSRFAVEGNNYYGMKEYDLTEPHMKAKLRPNADWGLRKYISMCASVEDYMNLLSTSYKYKEFQELLLSQWFKNEVDLFVLVDLLYNYAENPKYEEEIKNLIIKLEDM
tara:strand:- start:170 stop:685 length:516 start_codon:yes stop_codon:yes gene_type:complete